MTRSREPSELLVGVDLQLYHVGQNRQHWTTLNGVKGIFGLQLHNPPPFHSIDAFNGPKGSIFSNFS